MKRTVAVGACLLILASLLVYGVQNKAKDVPPGIDTEMWIPVADNFGIVLTKLLDKGVGDPNRRVKGTLMVKVDGAWRILNLNLPVSVVPIHE